jgi:hypothetical protein
VIEFKGARMRGPKTLLTLGMTPEDARRLARIGRPERFHFVPLGDYEAAANPETCRPRAFLAETIPALRRHDPAPDGVVAFDDYPASLLSVAIAEALGLPGPSLKSALICHHKLWSRVVQREAVPDAVPRFQPINLYDAYRREDIALDFPFWLKPIKSSLSHLAFRVRSMTEFEQVRTLARRQLPSFAAAFNELLDLSGVQGPEGFGHVRGDWLIAEETMRGRQCTLEGYVQAGRMHVMGIVDSIRLPNRVSFTRFQHPSILPAPAQREMIAIAETVLRRTGFDDGTFNIEFFLDARRAQPMIIEINPRFCPQFSDLYAKVDGTFGHEVLVELAAGLKPSFARRRGRHMTAASFVLRTLRDRIVLRSPSPDEVTRIEETFPEAYVDLIAAEGDRLSDLAQDSYTYRYALINLGAGSRAELKAYFRLAAAMLPYHFAPAASLPTAAHAAEAASDALVPSR